MVSVLYAATLITIVLSMIEYVRGCSSKMASSALSNGNFSMETVTGCASWRIWVLKRKLKPVCLRILRNTCPSSLSCSCRVTSCASALVALRCTHKASIMTVTSFIILTNFECQISLVKVYQTFLPGSYHERKIFFIFLQALDVK